MALISIITCSLCCRLIVSQTQLPTFLGNCSPKWQMKGTFIHAPFKNKCSQVLKNWYWHDFQTQHLLVQYAIFFYNSIVTKFCGLDVSLCFNGFDPPQYSKKGTSDYKVKKIVHMPGHILDLYCVRLLNAAPFCENYAKLYFDAKHL